MTKLEQAICRATGGAHRAYKDITGYWLWHSPEHFLQNFILLRLGREDAVYAEATRRKIEHETGKRRRGRPPRLQGHRYDLVVWQKTAMQLRAVIEIKRNYTTTSTALSNDADRIKQALTGPNGAGAGYLLVYTEIRTKYGRKGLMKMFSI